MWIFHLWPLALLLATVYCLVKAVLDFRARKYVWGGIGLASALVFMSVPISTHPVKVSLPVRAE